MTSDDNINVNIKATGARETAKAIDDITSSEQKLEEQVKATGKAVVASSRERRREAAENVKQAQSDDRTLNDLEKQQLKRQAALNRSTVQLGAQVSDFISQVAGGQNPLLAFWQQSEQMAQVSASNQVRVIDVLKTGLTRFGGVLFSTSGLLTLFGGALTAFGISAYTNANALDKLKNTLSLVGQQLAFGVENIQNFSVATGRELGSSVRETRDVFTQLASNANLSRISMENLGDSAIRLSRLSGMDLTKATELLNSAFRGTVNQIRELDRSYQFLSAEQLVTIRQLIESGNRMAAMDIASEALNQRLRSQTEQLGYLERAWRFVTKAASDAFYAGPDTLEQRLEKQIRKLEQLKTTQQRMNTGGIGVTIDQVRFQEALRAQQALVDSIKEEIALRNRSKLLESERVQSEERKKTEEEIAANLRNRTKLLEIELSYVRSIRAVRQLESTGGERWGFSGNETAQIEFARERARIEEEFSKNVREQPEGARAFAAIRDRELQIARERLTTENKISDIIRERRREEIAQQYREDVERSLNEGLRNQATAAASARQRLLEIGSKIRREYSQNTIDLIPQISPLSGGRSGIERLAKDAAQEFKMTFDSAFGSSTADLNLIPGLELQSMTIGRRVRNILNASLEGSTDEIQDQISQVSKLIEKTLSDPQVSPESISTIKRSFDLVSEYQQEYRRVSQDLNLSETDRERILMNINYAYAMMIEQNKELLRNSNAINTYVYAWEEAFTNLERSFQGVNLARSQFEATIGNMMSALDRFVDTGKLRFKDLVGSIIKDLIKLELKASATSFLKTLGAGRGNFLSSLGSMFGGFFADGGSPPVGRASIVGEKGPELFVPKTAGTIIPNRDLGGSSTVTTTTINISAVDAQSVARLFADNRHLLLGVTRQAEREMPYRMR